jgi:pilus assembly protein CpaE
MSADIRCLVVGADTAPAAAVAAAVGTLPGLVCAGVADPGAALAGLRPACDVVIVCDGGGIGAVDSAPAMIAAFSGIPVVLATAATTVEGYQAALAAGARGLIGLPPDHERLAAVVAAATEGTGNASAGRPAGRAVAVCGVKGGCGCSALATELAQAARGLLVDLAGGFDDAARRLGCAPLRGLGDVAALDGSLGADSVRALPATHPAGYRLIARSGDVVGEGPSPALARALVRESRAVAPMTAFDLGVPVGEAAVAVALGADSVLLVSTPDPAAVACAARVASHLEQHGMPAGALGLVVNRWSRGGDLSLRGIERAAGVPVIVALREGELLPGARPRRRSSVSELVERLVQT